MWVYSACLQPRLEEEYLEKAASKGGSAKTSPASKQEPETAASEGNPVIVEYADDGVAVGPFKNVFLAGRWERNIGLSGGHFVQRNNATDTHWDGLTKEAIPETDSDAITAAFDAAAKK
jgi:hypothetical protein